MSDERTGRFSFINRTFGRLLGYEPAELVGARPRDLHPPEAVPRIAAAFAQVRTGTPPIGPVPVLRRDGAVILAEVTAFRGELEGRPSVFGVFVDVTDRVRAERVDVARADVLAAIAGGASQADVVQRVTQFVEAGIPDATAEIALPAHLGGAEAAEESSGFAGRGRWCVPIDGPDGERWGTLCAAPIASRGPTESESRHLASAAAFVALAVDRARTIARQLEQSALEAAIRTRSSFLAHVGHEIRTPLHAVIGFAELLHDDPSLGERQRERVRMITRSGDHLLRLVTDLLDAARFDADAISVRNEPFPLAGAFDDVAALFRARAEAKGLVFGYRADLPERAVGDAHVLRRVLINLLGNAVKFTSRGYVDLQVTWAEGRLRVDVMDSGPGIPPVEREQIYDPFFQGAAGWSMGGTGLGLPISRRMVVLMGGTLTLLDAPHGTHFRVEIPLPLPAPEPPQPPPLVEGTPHPSEVVVARATLRAILAAAAVADVAALELLEAHRGSLRAAFGSNFDAFARDLDRFDFPAAALAIRDLLARG